MAYRSPSRVGFEIVNYAFFLAVAFTVIAPFLNAIAISLSGPVAARSGRVGLLPIDFNFDSYRLILLNRAVIRAFVNTVFLTVVNSFLVIVISLCAGYALASRQMIGRKIAMIYLLIPWYFSGGLIPFYIIVNRLRLENTYAALILPSIVSIFYIIVFRNSISQLPQEMRESAEIDGAGEFTILFRIVMPLILPMVAAFVIFSAVGYWNEWFNVLLFIRDSRRWTLQYKLRDILTNLELMEYAEGSGTLVKMKMPIGDIHPLNLQMAALMVTILPIIVVYPFLQRYFIHGIIVGAVKG